VKKNNMTLIGSLMALQSATQVLGGTKTFLNTSISGPPGYTTVEFTAARDDVRDSSAKL